MNECQGEIIEEQKEVPVEERHECDEGMNIDLVRDPLQPLFNLKLVSYLRHLIRKVEGLYQTLV